MQDEEKLNEIRNLVYNELRMRKAAPTGRNIIQMMFILKYADWLGGESTTPSCPFE